MKCHYEVLGIERTADDKTIKNGIKLLQQIIKYRSMCANTPT